MQHVITPHDIELGNARRAERERCAKICDEIASKNIVTRRGEGADLCADAIRNLNSEAK